jgi:hypothetical protein
LLLFAVIVVLGIAPSPFPSLSTGQDHSTPTVVLRAREEVAGAYPHGPATYAARPVQTTTRSNTRRANERGRIAAQPTTAGTPTYRAAPTPVQATHAPDPKPASSPLTAPTSAQPAPSADPTGPLPLPATPDPLPSVPTLPTVTTPPVEVPPVTVPTVTLP